MLERIATRAAEIGGGLIVRRALPNRRRRTVGAWCFLDHAGPMEFGRGGGMGVGPHPHIGLQTFTWMIEGAVMHRDSLGNEQLITPGQVNLMTAGRGIAHAEDSDSAGGPRLHAVQLWIALPDAERHRAPSFRNYPHLPLTVSFEHAALLLSGAASIEGEELTPGALLYLGSARERLAVSCQAAARLMLVGGAPFGEEILLWWNFVARDAQEMQQAARDWNAGRRFGAVRGSPVPRRL